MTGSWEPPRHQGGDLRLAEELARTAGEQPSARSLARTGKLVVQSARAAGAGAITSGRWFAEIATELATHVPVRDLETLRAQYDGLDGADLAGALIRNGSRVSAAVGAAAGALVGAEELAPPAWLAIPAEVVVETLVVAAVEMKLIAELHEIHGRPIRGTTTEKGLALVRAWAEGRGVRIVDVAGGAALSDILGHGARRELTRLIRRRMVRRLGRSLTALAPMLTGAVAAAEVNRRATVALGDAVVRDLAGRRT
jgi:hypothetical protein